MNATASALTETSTAAARPVSAPRSLVRFAWGFLLYNLAVIAWGAFVRATGSGAGCGEHWPLCNGEVVPRPKSVETVIELTHRVTSGLSIVLVVVLAVWTFRVLPKGYRARRGAFMSVVFMFGEALLGAGLVLFKLVGLDASLTRAFSMILHLGNTFFLVGAIALTCFWLTISPERVLQGTSKASNADEPRFGIEKIGLVASLAGVLTTGSTGAIAALGDTLFPSTSLRAGLAQDLSPVAHVFLRLRLLHPFIALTTGAIVLATAALIRSRATSNAVRTKSYVVTGLFVLQFCAGLLNLVLLAPIWMQLTHLLLADTMWIALVLLGWETLYGRGRTMTSTDPSEAVLANDLHRQSL